MASSDNTIMPIPIVAIGVGNRMRTYMHYVAAHPEEVKLVAIAEPDQIRRETMRSQFDLPASATFSDYQQLFASDIPFEAVLIATPGSEHFRPAMMALERGCHVLLEKPIAQNYEECCILARKAKEKNRIISVCHVMRYHPMFLKIKELVDSGRYGRIVTITHTEEVGIDRATHSYVRGMLNSEKFSNPMLLDKTCHDMDFLLWMTGSHCRRVSSFGSRLWFRKENAPAGTADRCTRCAIEDRCPYSAIDLYRRRKEWTRNFIPAPGQTVADVVENELAEGRFGRCVYHCDNDVVDNQVVTLHMTDGVLITLTMNVFTQNDCRTLKIGMTEGEITCDGTTINARHFRTRTTETFDFSQLANIDFHGGADLALVENFIHTIATGTKPDTDINDALEAHRIIFEAERSRHTNETITLN